MTKRLSVLAAFRSALADAVRRRALAVMVSALVGIGAAFASALLAAGPAAAQAPFPSRPVRLIVAFPGGTSPDIVARALSDELRKTWSQPVVVENRVGADGVLASDAAAKADPDGHTLYLATLGALALNPHLLDKLPYDPVRDFAGLTYVAENPFALAVAPDLDVKSVADLIALSKARAGKLDYGTVGSFGQMLGEAFKKRTGADLTLVPYRGAPQALTDLMGGRVPVVLGDLPSILPLHASGKVRIIAVSSAARSPVAPEIPTLIESGVEGFDYATWYALVAPVATPPDLVARLNADLAAALDAPEMKSRLLTVGLTPGSSSPQAVDALVKAEIARWKPLVEAAGIKR